MIAEMVLVTSIFMTLRQCWFMIKDHKSLYRLERHRQELFGTNETILDIAASGGLLFYDNGEVYDGMINTTRVLGFTVWFSYCGEPTCRCVVMFVTKSSCYNNVFGL